MTIGQAAYDKWYELFRMSAYTTAWDQLPLTQQEYWEEIAEAAVNQHIDDGLSEE